jgi:hypothetical protein
MPGTWISMPTICTSRKLGAYAACRDWADQGSAHCDAWADHGHQQCAAWADHGHQACSQWADEGHSACSQWSDQGHDECCDWAPCSWVCDAFYWVANWVCQAWYWVANWVCHAWYWVANWVCQAWYWVANWVCKAWYWVAKWVCLAWVWIFYLFCVAGNGGAAFLLTDGSILMNECASGYGTRRWWKLGPNAAGDYRGGLWKRVADSLNGRKYFASAVLADGRLVVAGGEYTDTSGSNQQDESNKCEVYDPVANSWSSIASPPVRLGDAAACLLHDGRMLAADLDSSKTFLLDPVALTWSAAAAAGAKSVTANEESWVLMADNSVVAPECGNPPNAEKYDPASDQWVSAGALAANIVENASSEVGPAVLLPDGRAFFVGSNAGNTAIYTSGATPTAPGTWIAGPAIPQTSAGQPQGSKDGPGALEPGGKVLFPAAPVDGSRANYLKPCSFFEFDGKSIARVNDPPNANCKTYVGRLLVLPSGDIFWAREDDSRFYLYQSTDSPQNSWRPVITGAPPSVVAGTTFHVSGRLFNGLSQASAYGDDYLPSTNYPIVRIRNRESGRLRYCRTANHTVPLAGGGTRPSMGVATGSAIVTTQVTVPADIDGGASELFVVANGIPSQPFEITVVTH